MRLLLLIVVACLSYSVLGAQTTGGCERKTVDLIWTCEAGIMQLNAQTEPGTHGIWTVISGSGIFSDVKDPQSFVSGLARGENTFKWTNTDGPCKNSTSVVNISIEEAGRPYAGKDLFVCEGTTELSLTGNVVSGYQGSWSLAKGSGVVVDKDQPTTLIRNPGLGRNVFIWTFAQINDCPAVSDSVAVYVRERPEAVIRMRDTTYSCSNEIVLRAQAPEEDGGWRIAGGSGVIAKPERHETLLKFTERNQPVDLIWSVTIEGCPSSQDTTVVYPLSIDAEKIPNVITPNGDQKNDRWKIQNIERLPNQIRLYNRWGDQVMKISDYKNDWSGEGLPHDTYFFLIDFSSCGTEIKGWLHIID